MKARWLLVAAGLAAVAIALAFALGRSPPDAGSGGEVRPLDVRGLARGLTLALSFEAEPFRDLGPGAVEVVAEGGVSTGPGRMGRAARLDGEDDALVLPGSRPRTLAMWFRIEDEGVAGWYFAGDAREPGRAFILGTYREDALPASWDGLASGLAIAFFRTEVLVPASDLVGGWHHLVLAWDGERRGRVALDGELRGGAVAPDRIAFGPREGFVLPRSMDVDPALPAILGRFDADWWGQIGGRPHFRGSIDELATWDRQLEAEEMLDLFRFETSYCEALAGTR